MCGEESHIGGIDPAVGPPHIADKDAKAPRTCVWLHTPHDRVRFPARDKESAAFEVLREAPFSADFRDIYLLLYIARRNARVQVFRNRSAKSSGVTRYDLVLHYAT